LTEARPGEPSWSQAISNCSSGRAGNRVRARTPGLIWVLGQLSGDKMIDGVTRVERCGRSVFRGRPGWRRRRYRSRSQSICLTRGKETRAGRRFRRQPGEGGELAVERRELAVQLREHAQADLGQTSPGRRQRDVGERSAA